MMKQETGDLFLDDATDKQARRERVYAEASKLQTELVQPDADNGYLATAAAREAIENCSEYRPTSDFVCLITSEKPGNKALCLTYQEKDGVLAGLGLWENRLGDYRRQGDYHPVSERAAIERRFFDSLGLKETNHAAKPRRSPGMGM